MDLAAHLADLIRASSITGREQALGQHLLREWRPVVDEAVIDRLGSYIGLKRGSGSAATLKDLPAPDQPTAFAPSSGRRRVGPPRVMVAAHIDSIGFMVTAIEAAGFLRFTHIGGVDRRLLMAQEVEVHGRRVVPGLIGSRPPHLTAPEERNKVPAMESLYIDTGLPESEVRELIRPGDPVLYRYLFRPLQNGRYAGRYMDNRASVAALRFALEELQGLTHAADLYAVGTMGEEFGGLPGAATAAFAIKPDIAIAVDVTFGKHPGAEEDAFPIGGGPTITVGPNATPRLARLMRSVAEELGIDFSLEVLPGNSGTDAWAIQTVRGGIATGILSIPLRYMHTPVETVDLADIRSAGRLLAHLTARVNDRVLEELSCY